MLHERSSAPYRPAVRCDRCCRPKCRPRIQHLALSEAQSAAGPCTNRLGFRRAAAAACPARGADGLCTFAPKAGRLPAGSSQLRRRHSFRLPACLPASGIGLALHGAVFCAGERRTALTMCEHGQSVTLAGVGQLGCLRMAFVAASGCCVRLANVAPVAEWRDDAVGAAKSGVASIQPARRSVQALCQGPWRG